MKRISDRTIYTIWTVGIISSIALGHGIAYAQCDGTTHYGGAVSVPGSKVFTACGSQIKTRWSVLCGAGGFTSVWTGLDSVNVSKTWIQTGYINNGENRGSSTDPDYEPAGKWYYVEWENDPNNLPHHQKNFAGPAEGSQHNYSVTYVGAGKWMASYGAGTYNITDTMPCAFYNAEWRTEPHNTTDRTPGTIANKCTFTGCYVKDATHANQPITQASTPYKFTGVDATTALTATSVSGSEIDCWDPNPNEQ